MELSILGLNFVYALLGAVCTIAVMAVGYIFFDRLTPFDTGVELYKGNVCRWAGGRLDLRGGGPCRRACDRDGTELGTERCARGSNPRQTRED